MNVWLLNQTENWKYAQNHSKYRMLNNINLPNHRTVKSLRNELEMCSRSSDRIDNKWMNVWLPNNRKNGNTIGIIKPTTKGPFGTWTETDGVHDPPTDSVSNGWTSSSQTKRRTGNTLRSTQKSVNQRNIGFERNRTVWTILWLILQTPTTITGNSAPRLLDTFGLNPHSQLDIGHHWLPFLNQVRKNLPY